MTTKSTYCAMRYIYRNMKKLRELLPLIVLLVIVFAAFNIFQRDTYTGFFYPDASNLFVDIQSEENFESLSECRVWAKTQALKHVRNVNLEAGWDYECGKNCNFTGSKPYVCEESLQ